MKLEFSRRIFEKYLNFKFSSVYLMRADSFHVGGRTNEQTDEHEEANIRFSQFANAPKTRDVAISVS